MTTISNGRLTASLWRQDHAGMEIPQQVAVKLRASIESRKSIDRLLDERNIKLRQVAIAISTKSTRAELALRVMEQGKRQGSNIRKAKNNQSKLRKLQEIIQSPKPDWRTVERALDRTLKSSVRIERELKAQEREIDQILAACMVAPLHRVRSQIKIE